MTPRPAALTGCALAAAVGLALAAGQPPKSPPRPAADPPASGDHPTLGGGPDRNMVCRLPAALSHEFPKGLDDPLVRVLGSRVRWKATLGSRAYGGPIVAGGHVYCGTNNENPRNKRDRGKPADDDPPGSPLDKGVLMCFNERTGDFLWQMVHDKLPSGQVNDWPREGVCAPPTVEGDRVYYVSNRCEVVCLDVNGFLDGTNDGFQGEKYRDQTDGDVVWVVDMVKDLKVFPHNMAACSPLVVGDRLFVVTGNGVDENHVSVPSPDAPSFLCLDKRTGKVLWQSGLPGKNIMHAQWGHPAYGVFGGRPQVVFPGGDGWLYGLEPETGTLIWKFDASPKGGTYELGGRGTRSDFVCAPVVHRGRVYIGTGQDPEHSDGVGHFWCIDPAGKTGDISPDLVTDATRSPPATKPNPNSGAVWHHGGDETRPYAKRDYRFGRTMGTACIVGDTVYVAELYGAVQCLDANTGKKLWEWDTKSNVWGSCYYVDGKVLVANEDGDLYVFKHEKAPQVLDEVAAGSAAAVEVEKAATGAGRDPAAARAAGKRAYEEAAAKVRDQVRAKCLLQKVEVGTAIRVTPVVANGVLYVMTENALYAVNPK
jgi:outer membrane protein assembly factor BamB